MHYTTLYEISTNPFLATVQLFLDHWLTAVIVCLVLASTVYGMFSVMAPAYAEDLNISGRSKTYLYTTRVTVVLLGTGVVIAALYSLGHMIGCQLELSDRYRKGQCVQIAGPIGERSDGARPGSEHVWFYINRQPVRFSVSSLGFNRPLDPAIRNGANVRLWLDNNHDDSDQRIARIDVATGENAARR